MKYYAGKTVLITGAANGIGKAMAHMAAENGANLVIGDVALEALANTADEIRKAGGRVEHCPCDIRKMDQIEALVSLARQKFGVPDAVFANAGILGAPGDPWDFSEEDFARVIDVNLLGTWRTMKAVLPEMVARGAGSIVATASVAGLVGAAGLSPYVASKHGIVGLVRSVALGVAKSGVRVNALCPSMIDTAMVERLTADDPSMRQALAGLMPVGRMGKTHEVAAAALWLATDQASFVTGHAMAVDGGYVAQ